MSSVPAATSSAQRILEILNGPMQGSIVQISGQRFTIGRSEDNSLVVDDPKCSRHHALIESHPHVTLIKDVSNKNLLIVNDNRSSEFKLKNGDVIRIGGTKIKYRDLTAVALQPVSQAAKSTTPHTPSSNSVPRPSRRRPAKTNYNFYIIIGIIGALFLWLLSSSGKKNSDFWKIKTSSDVAAEIEASKKNQLVQEEELRKKGKTSRQYLEAQAAFIRGFRDYQNGQFGLANRAFREALAIYPRHDLAERYRLLSEQRIKEFIQNHMMEGRKYLDRQNFVLCASAYKKVMDTINDSQNATFKEAEQRWRECQTLQMGRF